MLFGLRHSPAGGNKFFTGRILRAQLYDRALDAQQVAASFRGFSDFVSEDELLAGLSPEQQSTYRALRAELASNRRPNSETDGLRSRARPATDLA